MAVDATDLEGLLVVELANVLAGPSVGMFLAELGATVIKVENKNSSGDATRNWKLPVESKETDISSYFSCVNWGKKSLGLDLKKVGGREVVYDLVRKADIVIQSYKPGDEKKLGLDYETLKALNPALIYGQITAYGPDDPRPGYDAIIQAESGFTYLNGEPGGPPTKMPVALVDLLLAHQMKEGILLALLKRYRTGQGSCIVTSLLKCATAALANQAANWLVAGVVPERMGSEHPNIVPYGTIFKTADGREVIVAAANDGQYLNFIEMLGLEGLKTDSRFTTNQQRVKNREDLVCLLREQVAKRTSDDVVAQLRQRKIPFGFVNNMEQVFQQSEAAALVVQGELPDGSVLQGLRTVVFDGTAAETRRPLTPPPHFNQHVDEILEEILGYSEDRVRGLRESGILA